MALLKVISSIQLSKFISTACDEEHAAGDSRCKSNYLEILMRPTLYAFAVVAMSALTAPSLGATFDEILEACRTEMAELNISDAPGNQPNYSREFRQCVTTRQRFPAQPLPTIVPSSIVATTAVAGCTYTVSDVKQTKEAISTSMSFDADKGPRATTSNITAAHGNQFVSVRVTISCSTPTVETTSAIVQRTRATLEKFVSIVGSNGLTYGLGSRQIEIDAAARTVDGRFGFGEIPDSIALTGKLDSWEFQLRR